MKSTPIVWRKRKENSKLLLATDNIILAICPIQPIENDGQHYRVLPPVCVVVVVC